MARSESVEVTAVDQETGDTDSVLVPPGDYCLVVTRPLRLVHQQQHANGTIVLTLQREAQSSD